MRGWVQLHLAQLAQEVIRFEAFGDLGLQAAVIHSGDLANHADFYPVKIGLKFGASPSRRSWAMNASMLGHPGIDHRPAHVLLVEPFVVSQCAAEFGKAAGNRKASRCSNGWRSNRAISGEFE